MNTDSEYIIHITLTPRPEDSPNKPYFWMVTRNDCNAGFGWSENPIKAMEEANNWYKYVLQS